MILITKGLKLDWNLSLEALNQLYQINRALVSDIEYKYKTIKQSLIIMRKSLVNPQKKNFRMCLETCPQGGVNWETTVFINFDYSTVCFDSHKNNINDNIGEKYALKTKIWYLVYSSF